MKCPYPISIQDKWKRWVQVPCGQCVACRLNKAKEWSIRLMNELVYHDSAVFMTLSFDDDHLPDDFSIDKADVQNFLKRFRKELGRPIRYFASGEYGDKGTRRWINPHYHLIIFGVSPTDPVFKFVERRTRKGQSVDVVKIKSWTFGDVTVGEVTYDSCCYVARYTAKKLLSAGSDNKAKVPMNKDFYLKQCLLPPFLLMSRRPGLGSRYLENHIARIEKRGYLIGKNGIKCAVPRYYKEKIKHDNSYVHSWFEYLKELKREADYDRDVMPFSKKNYRQYQDECLQNAKNIVDSYVERMEIK